MHQTHYKTFFSIFLSFFLLQIGYTQTDQVTTPDISIQRIYPYISITPDQLEKADSIGHLYRFYRPGWVEEYLRVEILTQVDGQAKSAGSRSDRLSLAQKALLLEADGGSDISILIDYLPKNNLEQNEPKDFNFTLKVEPREDASFAGGVSAMQSYLKEHITSKIPADLFVGQRMAAITFSINEEGEVVSPHLFWSSENEKVDQMLIETIQKMPCWNPAIYPNGVKVEQPFALTIGNSESCVNNLLFTQKSFGR